MAAPSQVLQPTCHWKWVGCTIPLKQDNFTLEASWDFNRACTHERVQLLDKSGYREPLFNWGNFHTCSGCDATAAWRPPPIWTFAATSICTRICSNFQSYFQSSWSSSQCNAVIHLTGLLEVFISELTILATVSDNSVRYQAISRISRF